MENTRHPVGSVLTDGTVVLAYEDDEMLACRGTNVFPTRPTVFERTAVERIMDEQELTQLNLRLRRWAVSRGMVFKKPEGIEEILILRTRDWRDNSVLVYDYKSKRHYILTDIVSQGYNYTRTLNRKDVDELIQSLGLAE